METYEGNAVLMVEGEVLTDGRMVAIGALTWPDTPIPVRVDFGGDPIGTVDRIWREGNVVRAHWTSERPLAGLSAAIATRELEGDFFGDHFSIAKGEIAEVVPTSTPACERARFEES